MKVLLCLSHYNLYRMAEFVGDAKAGYSTGQAIKALQETAQQVLPKGYGYEFSGLSREELKAGNTPYLYFHTVIAFRISFSICLI